MSLALPQTAAHKIAKATAPPTPTVAAEGPRTGTSSGINIAPGSDDDGWIVPPPVRLEDGTRLQLYKDGEALHAAYAAIKHAKQRICLEVYIFADDPTGKAFAELLCQKAAEGVKVYVIYDSFGSLYTDRGMFERMARLTEPGRREAAVLFADIQSSGELSRHLSSAAYFRLVQT